MEAMLGAALVFIGAFGLGVLTGYQFGWFGSERANLVGIRDTYTVQRDTRPDELVP